MDTEAQEAIKRLHELLDDLVTLETHLATARTAVQTACSNNGEAQAGAELGRECGTLLENVAHCQQRVLELEAQIEKDGVTEGLLGEISALADEVAVEEAILTQLNGAIEKLSSHESGQDAEGADSQEDAGQVSPMQSSIQDKDEKINALLEKLQAFEQQLEERDDFIKTLEERISSAKDEGDDLYEEVLQANAKIVEQQAACTSLEEQLRQRDAVIAAREQSIRDKDAELASLREEVAKMTTEFDGAKQEQDDKAAQLAALETKLQEADEARAKLELEIKMLLSEVEGLRLQAEEVETLERKVAKLEELLQHERDSVVRLKAQQMGGGQAQAGAEPENAPAEALPTKRITEAAENLRGRRYSHKQMGEILVEAGVITREQFEDALAFKEVARHRKLGDILVERGYTTEEVIAAALAAQTHVRFIENLEEVLQPDVINLVPHHLLHNHRCVPLMQKEGELLVAMTNPLDLIAIDNIELATNLRIEVAAATRTEVDRIITKYFESE